MTTAFEAMQALATERSGDKQLFRWGVRKTWAEGGEDPLEKVWAYACDDEVPHWHYLTSGMADPTKLDGDGGKGHAAATAAAAAASSGLGYELSFRLLRAPGEEEAPVWPVTRLQELGWGIFRARMKLAAGHYMRRRTVITGGQPPTALRGYYLVDDPQLAAVDSASGRIGFLQLVGITEEELVRCEAGEPDEVEAELRARSALGVTDLGRTMAQRKSVDLDRLLVLEQQLMRECVKTVPEGVQSFSVTVGGDGAAAEVKAKQAFALNQRADAALRLIVLAHESSGHAIETLRCQMKQKKDGAWALVMEPEYKPSGRKGSSR